LSFIFLDDFKSFLKYLLKFKNIVSYEMNIPIITILGFIL